MNPITEKFLPLVLSVAALATSVVVAFLQFRDVDDLRVNYLLETQPTVTFSTEAYHLSELTVRFNFANPGNQAAVLQKIDWLAMYTEELDPSLEMLNRCGQGVGGTVSPAKIEPVLIQPGDVKPVTVKFPAFVHQRVGAKRGHHVATCFRLLVSRSDASLSCHSLPALWFDGGGGDSTMPEFKRLPRTERCD